MATPIAHSIDNKTASRFDPFPTYKFHVEIGDITEAAFMECTGLQMSTEVFTYAEGGLNEYTHTSFPAGPSIPISR